MLKHLFFAALLMASPAVAADKPTEAPAAPKLHTIAMSDQDLAVVATGMNNVARLCASTDEGAPLCEAAAAWNGIRNRWIDSIKAETKPDASKGAKTP
jgi:hypothetical protein